MKRISVCVLLLMLLAPVVQGKHGEAVAGRYIVVLKGDISKAAETAQAVARGHGLGLGHVYTHALQGFAANVPPGRLAALRHDPRVASVEPDRLVQAHAQTMPTGVNRIDAELNPIAGIDGVDDRVDVDVAIIDTGIDVDHPDLNVVGGRHFYTKGLYQYQTSYEDDSYNDDNGHGTHVAGIVGALDNGFGVVGVAPGARLYAVKVLNASALGYLSDIIKGVDWVTAEAGTIDVCNMSLGIRGQSEAFRTAIGNSVRAGVLYTVSAGNDARDVYGEDGVFNTADDVMPAAYPEAATISALVDSDGRPGGWGAGTSAGSDDSFANFSNFSRSVVGNSPIVSGGAAIDLVLPGVDILSTFIGGGYATGSGTSMAAPYAAGLAALTIAAGGRDANGDGAVDDRDVYAYRQYLIDASSVLQTDPKGLAMRNDPDGWLERCGWAGPLGGGPTPVTDVAIASISAPASVVQGQTVNVNVTVTNVGDQNVKGDIDVTLMDNGGVVQTRTVSGLAAGASANLTFTWNTAGAAAGAHTLLARQDLADDNGANDANATTSQVTLPTPTMHVGDLDGTVAVKNAKRSMWEATVQAIVEDQDHAPVAGATVTAQWSGLKSGSVTGTTASDGTVRFQTGTLVGAGSVTFTVTGLADGTHTYVATANHDLDGSSDGTSITVAY